MDSIPLVCITGQVPEHLIGSDAFQETDITGITLTITKHNFLVTRAEEIAPTLRKAFAIATSGRPGPVLVDITKNAQQEECEFEPQPRPEGDGFSRRKEDERDSASVKSLTLQSNRANSIARANELLAKAKRPVILAGHGILKSGAMQEVLELAERAHIPVAMTLLGIGSVPAHHPLNLGMMGMHGEAWVNEAIQESDLLIAAGHALRRSRHRQARPLRAERQEDPHRHRSVGAEQERARRCRDRRRPEDACCATGCRS